jgi:transcriptional regulator with XRE-family HTH domain
MPSKQRASSPVLRYAAPKTNAPPLIRLLVTEGLRRGWTLAVLADSIGVSYKRFAQYRLGHADITQAKQETLRAIAKVLNVPFAAVFVLSAGLKPSDFIWPTLGTSREKVVLELNRLRDDSLFGAFVPDELPEANIEVQKLVAVLYREVRGGDPRELRLPVWLEALRLASNPDEIAVDALLKFWTED